MDTLAIILYFIVIPIAVILFSIALQKLINSPILVSGIVFIAFVIVALVFTETTTILILAAVGLGILSFITALLTCLLSGVLDRLCNRNTIENVGNASHNSNNNNINKCSRICCKRRICRR